jgi:c-di-AMP phosphodiesterase-like protein
MKQIFDSLTAEIKNHDKVIIMGHKNMDYDSLGSALGLYEIVESFDKEVTIYLDYEPEVLFNKALVEKMKTLNINRVFQNNYTKFVDEDTLLIIVDVNVIKLAANKELLKLKDIILLDHHIKSKGAFENTKITYVNNSLSSVCEFVTYYLRYLNKTVNPEIATIMLAGIEVDTNNFHSKITSKTFIAASYLMEFGADSYETQDLLDENKDDVIKRTSYLSKSYVVNDKIMICPLDEKIVLVKDLAIISDMQLRFTNIELGFVIGRIDKELIGISARSNGKYNVEELMKKFDGGGHYSEAAAQVKNKTIKAIEKELKKYLEEVK